MTKLKRQRQGLPPLDLRVQDHYKKLLTVSQATKLSGFSKQFIYQLIKSNKLCYRILEGEARIKYRHLRAWFTKLPSNKDCPLCPASLSLAGLMNYTKMGRSWVLHFVERHYVRSYYFCILHGLCSLEPDFPERKAFLEALYGNRYYNLWYHYHGCV